MVSKKINKEQLDKLTAMLESGDEKNIKLVKGILQDIDVKDDDTLLNYEYAVIFSLNESIDLEEVKEKYFDLYNKGFYKKFDEAYDAANPV